MSTNLLEKTEPSDQESLLEGDRVALAQLAAVSTGSLSGRGIDVNVQALKTAARLNALKTSGQEMEALIRERQSLLQNKFIRELSEEETNRLAYVRWSLDRIEDAKYGQQIDELADAVVRYKQALHDLQSLRGTLNNFMPRRKK